MIEISLNNSASSLDSRTIPDGVDQAVLTAEAVIKMIEKCGELHAGDTITVREV